MSDLIQNITASIIAVGGGLLLFGLIICGLLVIDMDKNIKDEYIKKLNEHDKAVVMDYLSTGFHFKKKKKKSNIEKLIDEEIKK